MKKWILALVCTSSFAFSNPSDVEPLTCIDETQALEILEDEFDMGNFEVVIDDFDSEELFELTFVDGKYHASASASADFGCGGPVCDDDFTNLGNIFIEISCDGTYSQEFELDTPSFGGHD